MLFNALALNEKQIEISFVYYCNHDFNASKMGINQYPRSWVAGVRSTL